MNVFDSVQVKTPNKNVFNLSHDVKATYNFDKIYPFLCQQVYPGDTFNCRAEVFMRAMPMLAPVLHNVDLHVIFAFIPHRLTFNENRKKDWKTFITGGEDGLAEVTLPYSTYVDIAAVDPSLVHHGSLLDHMGFPSIAPNETVQTDRRLRFSTLPFRAYQLFWNEYGRNQNVQNEVEFSYDEGPEDAASIAKIFRFRKKCWEKDYFTSCLPWAQRGEAVKLPIGGTPTITGNASVKVTDARIVGGALSHGLVQMNHASTTNYGAVGIVDSSASNVGSPVQLEGTASLQSATIRFTGLEVGTINDFRYCLRLQQWLENNARCGSRYIEQLFSHFGVVSSDARLQRPEILGGGKIPLLFTDVEQTTKGNGEEANVLGNLGGKGTLYGKTDGFKKYFEEHGTLLGMLAIIPRTSYSQGVPRQWQLMDKTEFYFPEFANLGEQAVLKSELYYDPATHEDVNAPSNGVFGYQGRFTELRYIPSTFHGEMRSDLAYWHFGRIFDSMPALNSGFVEAGTVARVWAIDSVADGDLDPFVAQIHLDIKAVRPLPKYATPTL